MQTKDKARYTGLILRIFLGLTVLFWGYEKLVVEKLSNAYTIEEGDIKVKIWKESEMVYAMVI